MTTRARVRTLAVDFGGTLARPGPRPVGATVAAALNGLAGTVIPHGFADAFDAATQQAWQADRASGAHTSFPQQLVHAADMCGAVIPDAQAATEAVFTAVPDATVDPRAAEALRVLHAAGLRCVLACDTQRTEAVRRRTLRAAGIEDCFAALVMSSTLGVRKPHPRFYDTVLAHVGCPADEVLFIGDTPAKDAAGPHAHGMRAVLITTGPRPEDLPTPVGVLGHFAELPGYLQALLAGDPAAPGDPA